MKVPKIYWVLSAVLAGAVALCLAVVLGWWPAGETICLFHRLTGLPCPSCGSTRALLRLMDGDVAGAWALNPLGFLLAALLITLPLWILYDLFKRKQSLSRSFQLAEEWLRRPVFAVPAVLIIIANWIWNISKNL